MKRSSASSAFSESFSRARSVSGHKHSSDRSHSQNRSSPNVLQLFLLHSVLFLWPLSNPSSPPFPFTGFPLRLWKLPSKDSSVLPPYFFPSGHKQKSLRAVALSPRQGRGHGIHHSLWLSYTSAQLKVKAITGLSLPLWPPPLSLFFALLFTKLYFSYSPPWPHFLRSHRAAWAFSPSSVLTRALFFFLALFFLRLSELTPLYFLTRVLLLSVTLMLWLYSVTQIQLLLNHTL